MGSMAMGSLGIVVWGPSLGIRIVELRLVGAGVGAGGAAGLSRSTCDHGGLRRYVSTTVGGTRDRWGKLVGYRRWLSSERKTRVSS